MDDHLVSDTSGSEDVVDGYTTAHAGLIGAFKHKKPTIEIHQNQMHVDDVMAMNRSERRRIAKLNNIKKIPGTTKPFVKESTLRQKGIFVV